MVSQDLDQLIFTIEQKRSHLDGIVLMGATASGKTALAHTLHQALSKRQIASQLVNLDAFQIYTELSIGTAKPTLQEQHQYGYQGLDLCSVHEHIDANTFAQKMRSFCTSARQQGLLPIAVGGSGLYLRAFLYGLHELPQQDEALRSRIKAQASLNGWPFCHQWLQSLDPVRAAQIHPNDKIRIERALEICLLTGQTASDLYAQQKRAHTQPGAQAQEASDPLFFRILCQQPPEILRERIRLRVQECLNLGWEGEVRALLEKYGPDVTQHHAFHAIGYRCIAEHVVHPNPNLNDTLTTQTWQYAKRQKTWFAKEQVDWVW